MRSGTGLTTNVVTNPSRDRARREIVVGLGIWCAIVGLAVLLVLRLRWLGYELKLDAPPLHATPELRVSAFLGVGLAVGALIVWRLPVAAGRLRWGSFLALSFAAAAAFSVALALVHRGPSGLTEPLQGRYEYLDQVGAVGSPGSFLHGFADAVRLRTYSVHVHGHPPGFLLLLWTMRQVGLGGAGATAAIVILAGAAAVPCVLIATRNVASEVVARRAAPFLVVAPAMVWVATSADALFMGVVAAAVTAIIVASGRVGRRGDALAVGGGIGLGLSAFLSYGLVLVAIIPMGVVIARRRTRPLVLAALGALAVCGTFAAFGFWWLDGLAATRERYFAGVATQRPYATFVVANLGIFAIVLGPAIAVALVRLREARVWLVVGATLTAVVLADLSGMSRGEVERIWLPFAPWILIAGAALGTSILASRRWLAVQLGAALAVEVVVRTAW